MKLDDVRFCIKCRKIIAKAMSCCEEGVATIYYLHNFRNQLDALILRCGEQLHFERERASKKEAQ